MFPPVSKQENIALTFAVNNLGNVSVTEVDDSNLRTKQQLVSVSEEGNVVLSFSPLLDAKSDSGQRLEMVEVITAPDLSDDFTVGSPVDFGPDGSTFDPPIDVALRYTESELPANPDLGTIRLALFVDGEWVDIPSTHDPDTRSLYAAIDHFSTYTILVDQESDGNGFGLIGGLAAAGLGIAGGLFWLLGQRRYRLVFESGGTVMKAAPGVPTMLDLTLQGMRSSSIPMGKANQLTLTVSDPNVASLSSTGKPFYDWAKGQRVMSIPLDTHAIGELKITAKLSAKIGPAKLPFFGVQDTFTIQVVESTESK